MSKGKVLFIDTAHPQLRTGLEEMGWHCDYFPAYGRADFLRIIPDYAGVVIRSKIRLDAEFMDHTRDLQFIARVGAGMENIDTTAAEAHGVICLNAPEGNRNAVAEQALGMLLMLFNNLLRADAEVRQGIWKREENRGVELDGKTVAIIGYGNTGSSFARKLRGFDVRVMAYDLFKTGYGNEYVEECTMDEIFEQADVVSFHVPLTELTRFMVDAPYLNRFAKKIWLVNTSRGKVVRTADLMDALESGKVLGACLDVLEYEGLSFEAIGDSEEFNRLRAMPQVVLSPHIAGWTHESNLKMAHTLLEKIARL